MKRYLLDAFGTDHLHLQDAETPSPGPGEVRLDVKALSLNFRDILVCRGLYNPKLPLPATPLSDGAGVIGAVGPDVADVKVGDRACSHFISAWIDGPMRGEYRESTLGMPGAGLAAEQVILPAQAVVPLPKGYDFAQGATLPIAALTAWSSLFTEFDLRPEHTVLTLGTGGVSIFALQFAKAAGAKVIITSSRDEKLERTRELGADHTINYHARSDWENEVLEITDGRGADVVIENGGIETLDQSMKAVAAGGTIAMLGALTGLRGEISLSPVLMKRIRIAGIFVDSRAAFEAMNRFIERHEIDPLIDVRFPFAKLPEALDYMQTGQHFGKIVIDVAK